LTHENFYYLLPPIYTCEYVYIYPRGSGIRSGFGYPRVCFGDGFPPESVFGSGSGFGFGCTETPPDPNPIRCHPYLWLLGQSLVGGFMSQFLIHPYFKNNEEEFYSRETLSIPMKLL
jgi:hypothetical protein